MFISVLSLKLQVLAACPRFHCKEVVDPKFKLKSWQDGNSYAYKELTVSYGKWEDGADAIQPPTPPMLYTHESAGKVQQKFVERKREISGTQKEQKTQKSEW